MDFNIIKILSVPFNKICPPGPFLVPASQHAHTRTLRSTVSIRSEISLVGETFKELRNANFLPPPPFGKIKNQDPFRRKTWTTGQISKTLRKFRNAIPPQKNKKSIFPPWKTSSTCLICKTFRNFEMQIFCPPPWEE